MIRFPRAIDIVTLFSKAGSPASTRIAQSLKNAAIASANADSNMRVPFEVDVTEQAPTEDQVRTILSYVGANGISSIISGATSEAEALKKYKLAPESFRRPVVVDWNNAKVVAGENESEILKMVNAQKQV
ncbi:hypothetical protein Cpir12675_000600 [Ceratocystis pirilliformis]|uniref:Redox protein fmp46 mitochondrial n=1 Tax=Ceratocystis pirilliformis TaxID=259994 RepID=A0ABR3ZP02_9PEZI